MLLLACFGRRAAMAQTTGKNILIVDKHPNTTQLLVKQIMFAGLNPVVAITGEGGLKKVTTCRPDLILVEMELTDMDGLDFLSLLKRVPENAAIPVVAMSIYPYLKDKCLRGGCNDFLQKPVKMIELMGHVRRLLSSNPKPHGL